MLSRFAGEKWRGGRRLQCGRPPGPLPLQSTNTRRQTWPSTSKSACCEPQIRWAAGMSSLTPAETGRRICRGAALGAPDGTANIEGVAERRLRGLKRSHNPRYWRPGLAVFRALCTSKGRTIRHEAGWTKIPLLGEVVFVVERVGLGLSAIRGSASGALRNLRRHDGRRIFELVPRI